MKLYRFSPVQTEEELRLAILHIHRACYELCKQSFGSYFPNAGNIGYFCHYDDEYKILTNLRKQLCEPSDNPDQKYFRLLEPLTIPAENNLPEVTYTYLYIRKPDPYRHHVGDIDFYVEPEEYTQLKSKLNKGGTIPGARIFPREDLDMIELYHPNIDALAYLSPRKMAEKVRIKVPGSVTDLG